MALTGRPRGRPRKDQDEDQDQDRDQAESIRTEARQTAERVAKGVTKAADETRKFGKRTRVLESPTKRGDVRFQDVGLATLFAAGSVLFTATRPTTGAQVGWGAFFTGLGGLAGAEAEGAFLKFAGLGTMGANAAFLALRALKPDLRPKE